MFRRLIKSDAEIQKIREAAAIMDKVMSRAVECLKPGTRGCDLAAEIMHAQAAGAGDYGGTFTGSLPTACLQRCLIAFLTRLLLSN